MPVAQHGDKLTTESSVWTAGHVGRRADRTCRNCIKEGILKRHTCKKGIPRQTDSCTSSESMQVQGRDNLHVSVWCVPWCITSYLWIWGRSSRPLRPPLCYTVPGPAPCRRAACLLSPWRTGMAPRMRLQAQRRVKPCVWMEGCFLKFKINNN